ncbi:MAG TPA: 50S ribosomal protein L9 [Candidatus Baltobacteraceae bacterium]|nr:50S ribosomal protein L9 [Candidatus Baltobacteraceae bacterium]
MKIILLNDVKPLGNVGAVVEVADGYARNYLLPRGLAAEASSGALALLEQQRRAKSRRDAEAVANAESLAKQLTDSQVTVFAKSGGNGKLFGAITNANIAEALQKEHGIEIDRHKIEIADNIKSLGSYPVEIRLGKNVVAKTTVKVVAATN